MKHRVKNKKHIPFSQKVYLLAGSNMGNSIQILEEARQKIACFSTNKRIIYSNIYKSKAWGKKDQPDFFNQLWIFYTILPPHALLIKLLHLEKRYGRVRHMHWGPRTLDLDILYYGNRRIASTSLTVPHPQIANRKFTLLPLNELAPRKIHPILALSQKELLNQTPDQGDVCKY